MGKRTLERTGEYHETGPYPVAPTTFVLDEVKQAETTPIIEDTSANPAPQEQLFVITEADIVRDVAKSWHESIAGNNSNNPISYEKYLDPLNHNRINHCMVLLRPILLRELHLATDYLDDLYVPLQQKKESPEEYESVAQGVAGIINGDLTSKTNREERLSPTETWLRDFVFNIDGDMPDFMSEGVVLKGKWLPGFVMNNVWLRETKARSVNSDLSGFNIRFSQGVDPYQLVNSDGYCILRKDKPDQVIS